MKPIQRARRSPNQVQCSACHRINWHAGIPGIIPGDLLYVCAWCVSALQHLYTDPEGTEAEPEEHHGAWNDRLGRYECDDVDHENGSVISIDRGGFHD